MTVQLYGSLPGLINENTPLWDWVGQLRLGIDPGLVRFVELTGIGGNFFDAALNRSTGMVTITPISVIDYESLVGRGMSPTLDFGIRFYMADGTVETGSSTHSVTVLNLDDTPPQALFFRSGGSVAGGAAGAVIGTLGVTDPDTGSGFTYTVREDDAWMFEVVGGVLKLKDGVSIPMSDGPTRPVVIEVSDGTQSSAFTLDIRVTLPGGTPSGALLQGMRQEGFYWTDGSTVRGDHMLYEVASLTRIDAYYVLTMRDGDVITFKGADKIELMDGTVYFDPNSKAAWLWNACDILLDRQPSNFGMWSLEKSLDILYSRDQVLQSMLGESAHLSNAQFVEMLYKNSWGIVESTGYVYHVGRLDHGTSRLEVTKDFMSWRETALHQVSDRAAEGIFVAHAYVQPVDVVLKVGGGYGPTATNWTYAEWVATGKMTVADLARAVMGSSGYLAHMGQLGTADFVREFFTQAVGRALEPAAVEAFTKIIDEGSYSRAQFMEQVAWNVSRTESYVYQLPQGTAFELPW